MTTSPRVPPLKAAGATETGSETPAPAGSYTADNFRVLEGLEPVRMRPGMYIGSTTSRGLHHLLWEIVDNAVDEALGGYCATIVVELLEGNVVQVTDDGRGIPVDIHRQTGLSALDIVFTKLHGGGKFGDGGYKVSGGLHGVGAAVTNALSLWLEAEVQRDGHIWTARYERGQPVKPVGRGPALRAGARTGTVVRWRFDTSVFDPDARYSFTTVEARLREKAFLVKGLKFILRWPGHPEQVFCSTNGIADYVREIDANGERAAVHPHVVHLSSEEHPDPQFSKQPDLGRSGLAMDCLERQDRRDRAGPRLCQCDLDGRRGHSRRGAQGRAHERPEPLRLRVRPPETRQERGLPPQGHLGGAHGGRVGQAERPSIRGPDQGQVEQLRSEGSRTDLRLCRVLGLATRQALQEGRRRDPGALPRGPRLPPRAQPGRHQT